ncbi:MAG: hypothetical protein R3Y64_08725 [Peptostreptococcaceae bacterium]
MTKNIDHIYIEEELLQKEKQKLVKKQQKEYDDALKKEYEKDFNNLLDNYDEKIKEVFEDAQEHLKQRFVFMGSKKVVYDNETVLCIPNTEYYDCVVEGTRNHTKDYFIKKYTEQFNFENLKWDFFTLDEHRIFLNKNINYPFKYGDYSVYYNKNKNTSKYIAYSDDNNNARYRDIDYNTTGDSVEVIVPVFRLLKKDATKVLNNEVLYLWLKNGLIPMNTLIEDKYQEIINIFESSNNAIEFDFSSDCPKVDRSRLNTNISKNILNLDLDKIKSRIKINIQKVSDISDEEIKLDGLKFTDELLNCDKDRFSAGRFDSKILTDINRGHWELEISPTSTKTKKVSLESSMVYRNPLRDVKEGGIVGIDFGTKSTIVAYQESNTEIRPMRIGTENLKKEVQAKHYENPTIMEFINLDNFIKDYQSSNGRPKTKWNDLTVSHVAFDSLVGSKSEDYYAYFNEIKQWCGNKNKKVKIKDKQGRSIDIPTFLELDENDFNPVEIYAYYLGLYINNMKNGIYLNYTLSFPVTYEKDIRNKIIESFEKGIKKSLPNEILEDETSMKNFKITCGASEPAAYAISALTEYGFDPEDDEKVFYGVFDFGGGTTDFDFGIFSECDDDRYDYIIEHFGAGGDRYLGGENILELLAFEVFKNNSSTLLQNEISFVLPPECKKFEGSEDLLNDSQEARINTRQLMEKLRPLWEQHENFEGQFNDGQIGVSLFKNDGSDSPNTILEVNTEELLKVVEDRIEKGIINFFECLRMAFENKNTRKLGKINIFLAGNSSKCRFVNEIFDKYIKNQFTELVEDNNNLSEVAVTLETENSIFELFPPLGNDDAYEKQKEMGLKISKDITRPTGKTGVAFGLLEGRESGNIKVINNNNKVDDEVKFKFYVGRNKKKKLIPILTPQNEYSEWCKLISASQVNFEIYYTTSPLASTNTLAVSETKRVTLQIDKAFENEYIYVRAVEPTVIEFAVLREEDFEKFTEIQRVTLS